MDPVVSNENTISISPPGGSGGSSAAPMLLAVDAARLVADNFLDRLFVKLANFIDAVLPDAFDVDLCKLVTLSNIPSIVLPFSTPVILPVFPIEDPEGNRRMVVTVSTASVSSDAAFAEETRFVIDVTFDDFFVTDSREVDIDDRLVTFSADSPSLSSIVRVGALRSVGVLAVDNRLDNFFGLAPSSCPLAFLLTPPIVI